MDYTINKKALHDYEILEKFEAGLVLTGQEVKSIRQGHINLKGAFVTLRNKPGASIPDAYLTNAHISAYKSAGPLPDYNPERPRKLLLRKKELKYLLGKGQVKGLTMVPLKVYTKRSLIKLGFALVRGRKKHDKRDLIKKRDIKRKIQSTLKQHKTAKPR